MLNHHTFNELQLYILPCLQLIIKNLCDNVKILRGHLSGPVDINIYVCLSVCPT